MARDTWHRLHKKIFILMGAFLFVWLVSSLVMLIPPSWFGSAARTPGGDVNYRAASLSPADVIARMEARSGRALDVVSVSLQHIQDQLLYAVSLKGGEKQLVDAGTGAYFDITPGLAESTVRATFPTEAPVAEIVQLHEHDTSYPWGALPAFRVSFTDNPSVYYLVEPGTTRVVRSSPASRLRRAIVSLHQFDPIESLTGSVLARKGLLVITCVVSLLGVITGYYLVFYAHRRRV